MVVIPAAEPRLYSPPSPSNLGAVVPERSIFSGWCQGAGTPNFTTGQCNGGSVQCFHPGENCHETPGNEKITDCDDPEKTNFLTSNQYQCRHSFEQYIY